MSYYDFVPESREGKLGQAIYLNALHGRRGFRYDQLGIEDDDIWREIFEDMGWVALEYPKEHPHDLNAPLGRIPTTALSMEDRMRPYDAKTERERLDLSSDNHHTKGAWILLGSSQVSICTQKSGESATGIVKIPRGEFNRLIDWYMKDQKPRKKVKP